MNRSGRKPTKNVFEVINALTLSTLIRLVAIALTALILTNFAQFTPREFIELIHTIIP